LKVIRPVNNNVLRAEPMLRNYQLFKMISSTDCYLSKLPVCTFLQKDIHRVSTSWNCKLMMISRKACTTVCYN